MRIWTVANQKGGVGKTTAAVTLGGLLAEQGKRVLMLDLDPHGSMTSYFRYDPDTVEQSVYSLFQHQGKVPADLPRTLIRPTSLNNLSLMPASTLQATLERKMVGVEGMGLIIFVRWRTCGMNTIMPFLIIPPVLGFSSSMRWPPVSVSDSRTDEYLALKGLGVCCIPWIWSPKSTSWPGIIRLFRYV